MKVPGRYVFRPGSAWPLLGISAAVVLFLLGDAVIRGGWGQTLLLAPWPLLALWGVYAAAFASSLAIDDDAATVQNILQIVRVPWARVDDLQWRWQVEISMDDGSHVRAIGGPLQGKPGRRPGDPAQTPAGTRAQYEAIERAWHTARQGEASDEPVRRGWDVRALIVLAVLVVWAVIALLITGGPS
ncbi:PH domain-containing protein [Microbacterium sp.]|uniref:PH domain-containing protein n=1 Tax=Microbacterium sp. TaxID=51671 RepID=UPI003A953D09